VAPAVVVVVVVAVIIMVVCPYRSNGCLLHLYMKVMIIAANVEVVTVVI